MVKIKKTTVIALFGLGVLIYIFGGVWGNMDIFTKNDFKLMVVADDGLALISISPSRGMVSFLEIDPKVMVWVPSEYGFYQASKIKRLLSYEKKDKLIEQIAFFNFGMATKRFIYVSNKNDWEDWSNLIKTVGLVPTIALKVKMNDLFFDKYKIDKDLVDNIELDQVLTREFSNSLLIEEGFFVSINNDSDNNMMASFFEKRLTWLGLNVMAVTDWDRQSVGCMVNYGSEIEGSQTKKYLEDVFFGFEVCQLVKSDEIRSDEIEIVLDKSWAQMVNYNSYVRSF